ncbi:MAG: InlB B-repeat-containing protein [Bacillales bacterium]|jgi:transcriptional antiterminator NusG|nr:InlB B-repeat-containing protein [Bacillales bacterium]
MNLVEVRFDDYILPYQGKKEIEPLLIEKGNHLSLVQKPVDPIKEGYIFVGWYADDEFKEKIVWEDYQDTYGEVKEATSIESNTTLYANWQQWFMVSTKSGAEKQVKKDLQARVENAKFQGYITEILVAEQEQLDNKGGKYTGKTKKENPYKGYIFVRTKMTDDSWYLIRNTPNVTGMVGSSGKGTKPFPVSEDDMEAVLKLCGRDVSVAIDKYFRGAKVEVIKGFYKSARGIVRNVFQESKEVEVEMTFFSRPLIAKIDFDDIKKVDN